MKTEEIKAELLRQGFAEQDLRLVLTDYWIVAGIIAEHDRVAYTNAKVEEDR